MELNAAEIDKFRARTRRSKELFERTKEIIPTGHGGGIGYFVPHAIMVERAKGCWLWDVDGNRYLDLRIGDWVLIHGHCDDDIGVGAIPPYPRLREPWDRQLRHGSGRLGSRVGQ